MSTIEYKVLKSVEEFRECVSLQKRIFELTDIDAIPVAIMSLFAKEFPPIGIVIGAIDKSHDTDKLVGFFYNTAVLKENAIYGLLAGVLPEYQGHNVGPGMFHKLREWALPKKIKYMYGVFDPLEGIIGNAYINKLGFWGIKYQPSIDRLTTEIHSETNWPTDNISVRWDMDSQRTLEIMEGRYHRKKIEKILTEYPIVNENKFDNSNAVLVKIPGSIDPLRKTNFEEALIWRLKTRKIFNEYLNNRGYWVTEFYSQKKNGKRYNYYLLEKK